MSTLSQQPAATPESVWAILQESARSLEEFKKENREQAAKWEKERKAWNKRFAHLADRIGEIIHHMVRGDIVEKFQRFGYEFDRFSERMFFQNKKLGIRGEVDLFVEDGQTAMLVEVKTTLEVKDVRHHLERMEKFRRYADARGDTRKFIAAVAGAVVRDNAVEFAQENGMFVIIQSGKSTTIVESPEGFKIKEW